MDDMLSAVDGRTLVSVRVHMSDRRAAAAALELPTAPLTSAGDEPRAFSLAPDQWLLISETRSATALISEIESRLADLVCLAIDLSPAFCCYRTSDQYAKRFLASGSGVDFDGVMVGQGVRTRFANIGLIALRGSERSWELYIDVSHATYFETWSRRETGI